MQEKKEKEGVFDPTFGTWHFEAHGDRWASLEEDSAEATASVVKYAFDDPNLTFRATKVEGYMMMLTQEDCRLATILLPNNNGDLQLESFYPVMQGLPNLLTLEHIHNWKVVEGVEGELFANHEGTHSGITFFDPFFAFDVPRIEKGQPYIFYLAGWTYTAGKVTPKEETPIKNGAAGLENARRMNATVSEDGTTVSMRGIRFIHRAEYASEYFFQVPVEEVKDVAFCGHPMCRVTTTFFGVEDPIRGYLYIPKYQLGDYEPQVGDDIAGVMWLTGYLAQEENELKEEGSMAEQNPAPYSQIPFKSDKEHKKFERWLIDRSPFGGVHMDAICPPENIDWMKVYELWRSEEERFKEGWYCSFDDVYGDLLREFRREAPQGRGSLEEQYAAAKELMARDMRLGISKVMQLARKGYLPAMVDAGELFFYGYYLQKNERKAFEYFSKVHDAGGTGGTAYVAYYYLLGKGIKKDVDKVMPLLQQAAESEDPREYHAIGMCLLHMAEGKEQYEQAASYFRTSIGNGYYESCIPLEELVKGEVVEKAFEDEAPLAHGVNSGHIPCTYLFGRRYVNFAMDKDWWAPAGDFKEPLDAFRYGLEIISDAAARGHLEAQAVMNTQETVTLADGSETTVQQALEQK